MSTDLRQFFMPDHVPSKLKANSYEKFFVNAIGYTSQKAIDDLTAAFEGDESEVMIEDFDHIEFLRENIFPDIIDMKLEQVILSTFFDKDDIDLNGFDTQMECLYDEQEETFIEVNGIIPQLEKNFKQIYEEAKSDCEYYPVAECKKEGIDYYSLGVVYFLYNYINFKNKSKARKFRKLYKENYQIRAMLNGFGFLFIGGQFVRHNIINVECENFDDYLDINFEVSNEALEIMADASKKEKYDTENLQLEIERQLDECDYVTFSSHIINLLFSTLKTEKEVIM